MRATTFNPAFRNPSAISMGTRLQPLEEITRAESSGQIAKLRRILSASPEEFSRNMAWRCPFAPTTRLWKLSDSSTMGLNPGKDPPGPHLLDHDPAVAGTKHVDHSARQDGAGEPLGSLLNLRQLPFHNVQQFAGFLKIEARWRWFSHGCKLKDSI